MIEFKPCDVMLNKPCDIMSNLEEVLSDFYYTVYCSSSLYYVNEYLATDSVGYLYMNTLCELNIPRLNASQRTRDGVSLNTSGRE